MPKDKEFTKLIPRIYKWNCENLGMFFWVKAQMDIVKTVTLDQALIRYRKFAEIDLDEWDIDSMRATYVRLQKEFYER
jgi:hypothetical protein